MCRTTEEGKDWTGSSAEIPLEGRGPPSARSFGLKNGERGGR